MLRYDKNERRRGCIAIIIFAILITIILVRIL